MTPVYVGLDTHQSTHTYCVLDANGQHLQTVTVRGRWPSLVKALRLLARQHALVVGYEASLGYGTLYDQLATFCQRVVVAHPGNLRLIFRSRQKNDRVDAKKLAMLLLLDQLPAVHVPSVDGRGWRELIETRTALIHKRTRCKNGLRALLRGQGIAKPSAVGGLWTRKGLEWLASTDLPTTTAQLRRELLLAELDCLEQQVARVTAALDTIGREHPAVAVLMTIPGVGPRTAEAFAAYVDDPRRFAKTRRIGAYLGLVPSQDSSASVNRLGRITKQGPATVRRLLVEAAWRSIDHDPALRERFDRITAGKAERRKTALIATAHHLARVMLAMLKTGEAYRPRKIEYPHQQEQPQEQAQAA